MFYARATSKQCFDLFSGQLRTEALGVRQMGNVTELLNQQSPVFLLWNRQPTSGVGRPDGVVLQKNTKLEFLSWAHTYLNTLMPIGAFVRILDVDTASVVLDASAQLSGVIDPLLGLPACESLLHAEIQDPNANFLYASGRSCSFAAVRAIAVGYRWEMIAKTIDNWWLVRKALNVPSGRLDRTDVKDFFSVVYALFGKQPSIVESPSSIASLQMIEEYRDNGEISKTTWKKLTEGLSNTPPQEALIEGPRELRVPHLQSLLSSLLNAPQKSQGTVACFAGYAINQLAPGSLDHPALAKALFTAHPTVLLWYGLFAGLHKNGAPKGYFSSTAASLIRRELERPTWCEGGPVCDITADEIFMVNDAGGPLSKVRSMVPGQINVELLPGVNVNVRTVFRDSAQTVSSVGKKPSDLDIAQALRMAESLHGHLKRISEGVAISDVDLQQKKDALQHPTKPTLQQNELFTAPPPPPSRKSKRRSGR